MAIDGSRSKFSSTYGYTLDTFKEMFELSQSDVDKVKQWKELKAKGSNRTSAENTAFTNLTTALSGKIVTSEDWNKLLDAMYNLEKAYVDKGLDRVEALAQVVDNLNSTSKTNPLSANQGKILGEKLTIKTTNLFSSTRNKTTVYSCNGFKYLQMWFSMDITETQDINLMVSETNDIKANFYPVIFPIYTYELLSNKGINTTGQVGVLYVTKQTDGKIHFNTRFYDGISAYNEFICTGMYY